MLRELSLRCSAVLIFVMLSHVTMIRSLVSVGKLKSSSLKQCKQSMYQFARTDTALQAVKVAKSKTTGAFKTNLPDTFPSQTHYKRALRALKLIKADYSVKNIRNQERKLTAQSMDALMKGLTVPISEILNAYTTTFRNLHPFEVDSTPSSNFVLL